MSKNQTLQKLSLKDMGIVDSCAYQLFHPLSFNQNKSLKVLNLSNNLITSEGIIDIAKTLTINDKENGLQIKELYLNYNKLDHEAGPHIVKILKFNKTIIKLGIAFN
jgi:Ran GTPase-activating protein (RanGAP) involved in mRNA processing and transport